MPTSASTSLPYGRGPLLIVASRPTFKPIAALFTQGHALPRHLASIGSWQCAIRCMRLRLRAAVPRGDDQQASGDGIDRQIDLVNEVLEVRGMMRNHLHMQIKAAFIEATYIGSQTSYSGILTP